MEKSKRREKESGFGLSFLDVLCCGLGASVLLLLIVKHEPAIFGAAELNVSAVPEIERLESRVTELKMSLSVKLDKLEFLGSREEDLLEEKSSLEMMNTSANKDLFKTRISLIQASNRKASLEDAIKEAKDFEDFLGNLEDK